MARHWDRRRVLGAAAAAGLGSSAFARALAAQAAGQATVTPAMVQQAEWIAGLALTPPQRERLARELSEEAKETAALRALPLANDTPPALMFRPAAGPPNAADRGAVHFDPPPESRPKSDDDLAFLPVAKLAGLLKSRAVTSVELTMLALARLKRFDPTLHCVVTLTEELALRQAQRADAEIAAGRWRGPLHGVPWGAKDLVSVPGYPTTWGAPQYRNRVLPALATAARRMEDAGAVLVAKLSLGALAMGDHWFGGMTRNPWNPKEGSSGSSAGSAAAVAAGLVPFALGSETLGSIVSPCTRCGAAGLRPTFGRVSRAGCMALSWSMDKIGPIARTAEDLALVFGVLHGADADDPTALDMPFHWPHPAPLSELRVGYLEGRTPAAALDRLRGLGVKLAPYRWPQEPPAGALRKLLEVEAASAFEEFAAGVPPGLNDWPAIFRAGRMVSGVDFLRMQRLRTLLGRRMEETLAAFDVLAGPEDLAVANLTGHPTVVVPWRMVRRGGAETPEALTFTGRLFGEAAALRVAAAFQQASPLGRPPLGA